MRRLLGAFARDRRGAIAILSALLMTALVGFTALGVDVGAVYLDRRKAQSVADLAALAAASNIANADAAAGDTIARNRLRDAAYTLEYGVYTPNPALAPDKRFVVSAKASANAARVTLDTTTPLFFARAVTGRDAFAIHTTATAALSSLATISVGSRLLKVDGGLINKLLGGLLGTSLSLSAMDYNALIAMKLDAFDFLKALATRAQFTGVTYDTLLDSKVKTSDVVQAMLDTAKAKYGTTDAGVTAMEDVARAAQGLTTKIKTLPMIDPGPYGSLAVGDKPKVSAALSAYDMLAVTGALANGENQAAFTIDTNVPGIVSADVKLSIGERPKGTSWATFGGPGTTVHTAQTRLLLTVNLLGAAPYSVVKLPIYIEIAPATAQISDLACGFPDVATSTARVAVTPGVVDAWIGDVSAADFTNFSVAPSPGAATLVNVAGIKVTARAHANVGNLTPTPVNFSYNDILNETKKTVGTSNFTATLLSRLVGDLQLNVSVLGLGLGAPLISSGVSSLIGNAVSPVDQVLSSVLQTLGVGLGQADVWMSGIRCDGAVLVI
ncbi:MAG: pilus assembly protein TadG-related protein [Xanthobacteraceae bacterium]|uniref:pilus assembly protein TadG-related protein n=1 Tax=Pseudolabrys sp. TaxID=1960880 RepID=UPI003D11E9FF